MRDAPKDKINTEDFFFISTAQSWIQQVVFSQKAVVAATSEVHR